MSETDHDARRMLPAAAVAARALRRIARFLPRAYSAAYYPVVFNEPMSWVPGESERRGFSILSWAIPAVSWVTGEPPPGLGQVHFVTSERMVEMPFAHRSLAAAGINPPAQVLEFGCVHSRLALELASLGYRVTALDLQSYPFTHPNLTFLQGNLLTLRLEPGTFDAVTAISVMEHAGLEGEAGYGAAESGETDTALMERLQDLLRPAGLLVLTVPYGRSGVAPGYRVHDRESLDRLTAGWDRQEALYARRIDGEHWLPCQPETLADVDSTGNGALHPFPVGGVALLALRKR